MSTSRTLSVPAIAVRAFLTGAGLVLLLVLLVGRENVSGIWGPVVLVYWIAGIVGGYMMTWTRPGLRRWAWAIVATILLFALVALIATPVGIE